MLALRWFKDATKQRLLALDVGIGIATAYRYLHAAIDVIAAHAPALPDVLARAKSEEWPFVCLDGTLVETTKVHARPDGRGGLPRLLSASANTTIAHVSLVSAVAVRWSGTEPAGGASRFALTCHMDT